MTTIKLTDRRPPRVGGLYRPTVGGRGPDSASGLDDPVPAAAMIGGALWLMSPLARELRARGIEPMFAFSVRETEEQTLSDGSVRKVAVFRHAGFVPAVGP